MYIILAKPDLLLHTHIGTISCRQSNEHPCLLMFTGSAITDGSVLRSSPRAVTQHFTQKRFLFTVDKTGFTQIIEMWKAASFRTRPLRGAGGVS